MSKEEYVDRITDLLVEFAEAYPSSALHLITGALVGLVETAISEQGGDPYREICLEGPRDIVIYPPKEV